MVQGDTSGVTVFMPLRPTRRLVGKLLLAALLPTSLALAAFGVIAHDVASRSLQEDLGRRLAAAAAGTALQILPEQIATLAAGDEGSLTYARVQNGLRTAKRLFGVRRALAVAKDLTGRGDTDGRISLGARAHELGVDQVEIDRAMSMSAVVWSPLFWGHDGQPYKRAYAPIVDAAGAVVGMAVVEGSADYLASLLAFRRWMLGVGLGAVILVALVIVTLGRRLTGPLGRLALAADRMGAGDLNQSVVVETRDEVGGLALRLDEMRVALRARDVRMQMMMAGIAHEVRNPLGGLELFAGLLGEALVGQPERLSEVARIQREVGYLKEVVNEFLEFARLAPGERTAVEVTPLLAEVVEVVGPGVRVEGQPDLLVMAERGQLRRALVNLAKNGVAAAGSGGQVVLGASLGPTGRVEFVVRDNGPGVSAERREKIFEPFFTTREKGTGLGLAFVQQIVRSHGGDVVVDEAPGGGARFRFDLPAP